MSKIHNRLEEWVKQPKVKSSRLFFFYSSAGYHGTPTLFEEEPVLFFCSVSRDNLIASSFPLLEQRIFLALILRS